MPAPCSLKKYSREGDRYPKTHTVARLRDGRDVRELVRVLLASDGLKQPRLLAFVVGRGFVGLKKLLTRELWRTATRLSARSPAPFLDRRYGKTCSLWMQEN
ncbi:MAG: hypothetical protein QNJ54_22085 [Prochloraceae cyanobacterium]|nr:hypothetical protein [Prochloraceae cyanobacterium]